MFTLDEGGYFSLLAHIPLVLSNAISAVVDHHNGSLIKREEEIPRSRFITFAVLIPILVLLSGLFAGLTLGYMSLDETQLNVLSLSGTPQQRIYAEQIKPIRKNGHLLLVTLLLCNMIVNEALPVIADPILGGGFQSVVVSTVLIVIFSEIIPQSICTRHGLYVGAKMAPFVRVLLWTMGLVAWPVAKLLEWVLGPHHGIIYRRTELKELIAMHSSMGEFGGDLKNDTVTIIGATLDLQEKVVSQAMTPIKDVFMLSIDARLDYETLRRITATGHSRIPVFEEVEVSISKVVQAKNRAGPILAPFTRITEDGKSMIVRKIIGILLVKQCVLLDPGDAVPLRKIPLNKVPFVPNNEPLLGILDKFQEGRSHMAIVSRHSVEKVMSVKKVVKQTLTQRFKHRVGIDDSSSESESEDDTASVGSSKKSKRKSGEKQTMKEAADKDGDEKDENGSPVKSKRRGRGRSSKRTAGDADIEMGAVKDGEHHKNKTAGFMTSGMEQNGPADAVLAKSNADDFLQILDPAIMPLGIITLEDVLEELIGEEIYDEFDPHETGAQLSSYVPPESNDDSQRKLTGPHSTNPTTPSLVPAAKRSSVIPVMKGFSFLRSRSVPPNSGNDPTEAVASSQAEASARVDSLPIITLPEGGDDDNDIAIPQVSHSPAGMSPVTTPAALPQSTVTEEPKLPPGGLGSRTKSTSPEGRNSSANAPLEAILLDRKRRGAAGSGSPVHIPAPPSRVPSASATKGKLGFKSTPLSSEGAGGDSVGRGEEG